jgi:hypothetical protein
MTRLAREALLAFCAAAAAASVSACTPAESPHRPTVSLRVHGGPAQATVTIDDEFVGTFDVVAARGVALPLGSHRISIESPGYLPWDKIVEANDQPVRLDVQLVPVPD